ncbi:ABC transporter ATP-binding protein [Mycena kentingensis (nom. inval.)]|nr:ABC transporter ATP-binding protein [Mycena kentingensis (nom. inval.)]
MTGGSAAKDPNPDAAPVGPPIETSQLGPYRLVTEKPPATLREKWDKIARIAPSVRRLVADVYSIGPQYFFIYVVIKLWSMAVDPILSLHLSGIILVTIENGLKTGKPDAAALVRAVVLRMGCIVLNTLIEAVNSKNAYKMQKGLDFKLTTLTLKSKLQTDLTGAQEIVKRSVWESAAWWAFHNLAGTGAQFFGAISQLAYVFRTVNSSGHGPLFAALCLIHPLLELTMSTNLWSTPHLIEPNNPNFVRRSNLLELKEKKYKQDVITGDIVQHILKEFRKAVSLLGDTDIAWPYDIYRRERRTYWTVPVRLAKDLPMVYYAANAILNPAKFSFATIAILQKADSLLSWTFQDILFSVRYFVRQGSQVKAIYDMENVQHDATRGGAAAYPPADDPETDGMTIELKDLSFAYPNTNANALRDVSLSIKPGQLVVVVGSNGSGKSTIVKLLMRLYEPSSGEILLGAAPTARDIRQYDIMDLRRATAALTQDHHLFPLSIAENIGMGNPARVDDREAIADAARRGGAEKVVEKLKDGMDTVLERAPGLQWGYDVRKGEETLLAAELERLEKESDVSGGERQRLVAARTFMRFTTNTVKLVCVDEPSSNLDPEGELQLFDNLRLAREGKTMVFVTHRFGHLTKHADLIVCMKDGRITEKGTHEELMDVNGEYAKMYGIQAKAFE